MRDSVETSTTTTLETRLEDLQAEVAALKDQLQAQQVDNRLSLICFSGEWDRLFAALTIAAGGLAMGMDVHLFFTFWALGALRNAGKMDSNGKSPLQSMFNRVLPAGPGNAPLSRLNFGGLGKIMMKQVMKEKGVEDLDSLLNEVIEMGAHFHLCDTTAELFGLQCHELSLGDSVDQCGVATFLSHALKSKVVLFI